MQTLRAVQPDELVEEGQPGSVVALTLSVGERRPQIGRGPGGTVVGREDRVETAEHGGDVDGLRRSCWAGVRCA